MPVENRISSVVSTSVKEIAFTVRKGLFGGAARPPLVLGAASCSTTVFHAPQAGHFPTHLGVSLPHSVQ